MNAFTLPSTPGGRHGGMYFGLLEDPDVCVHGLFCLCGGWQRLQ